VAQAVLNSRRIELGHGPSLEVLQGGEGPPLVWLHGVRHVQAGDPLLQALAERFEVSAPVLPGKASLSELDAFPTIHDLVLFYDSALQALGIDHAVVAGHGPGGMLAAELAAHAPGRVSGLVLISPLGLWNDAYPVEDLFCRPQGAVDELLWRGSASGPPPPDPDANPVESGLAFAHALGGVAKYAWPIPDRGLRGRLWRITAPTLLMFADADALVPAAYAQDFGEGIADSRVHGLQGGHMAAWEAPDGVADVVSRFAAEL